MNNTSDSDQNQDEKSGTDQENRSDSLLNRRKFVKSIYTIPLLGVSTTVNSISANPTSANPTSADRVDESKMTERKVDISSGDEVSGIIRNVEFGELLVFPSGTFSWSEKAEVCIDDWGIRCQSDTVFEVPAGLGDGEHARLIKTVSESNIADNFLLENLTFDSPGRAAPGLRLGVRSAAHVDGLHYRMNGPTSNQQQENGISAKVTNEDGVLRIDDYRQFNNGDLGGYADGDSRIGIFVGAGHRGTVRLVNPILQGFPNNGCYVSRQEGTVRIEGGLLANNNVSAVRVSGGVEVHDTTIFIDTDHYVDGAGVIEADAHNTRGAWGDTRERGEAGGLLTGVSFVLQNYRNSQGLADILENPYMTLENCQFLLNNTIEAVSGDAGEIDVSGCRFDGNATDSTAGVGDITGSDNHLHPDIDPGQVTVASNDNYAFDWSQTHPDLPGQTLIIETPDDTDWMNYSFTADGKIVKGDFAGDNDSVTNNGDGTWTAEGVVGRGGTDDYEFNGNVESWSAEYDTDAYTLRLDSDELTPSELTGD